MLKDTIKSVQVIELRLLLHNISSVDMYIDVNSLKLLTNNNIKEAFTVRKEQNEL